ncbi:hypothetical protein HanRHA438_Chr05g0229771 [Helianthus annuus]|uniref:Uncharacterized protein n=1 Tax=Helianthus annuus TaxID=4232 RepID=A0A9K3J0C5_HELAN|nr:hypothetical protein HanXRQr2_Chr05g0220911 [Helianthus annuus]KAJ0570669.1 hypothetical protein HanHA300_Chr05g0180701 [Helianthus annuus]KAJ0577571.1 hypothetical protein HanIR_Chr05g0237501 [Helianthus annuus]KAJ0585012.1 hypothetical protein HanHA89_Chr05g0195401 [Helianthus annuus]KAJ0747573.1 hypothetical protein HanOQP8_Chr05g0191081 [Helianthus annuus]
MNGSDGSRCVSGGAGDGGSGDGRRRWDAGEEEKNGVYEELDSDRCWMRIVRDCLIPEFVLFSLLTRVHNRR